MPLTFDYKLDNVCNAGKRRIQIISICISLMDMHKNQLHSKCNTICCGCQ